MKLGKPKRFKTPSATNEDFSKRKMNKMLASKTTNSKNKQESNSRNHSRPQKLRTSSGSQFGTFVRVQIILNFKLEKYNVWLE